MDLLNLSGYNLRGLEAINVILGKNGCGKSRLLKYAEQAIRGRQDAGVVRYLSPERGGLLRYEANVEQNLTANTGWLGDVRRKNQVGEFRQQSAAQFRRLELLFLREMESDAAIRANLNLKFDAIVSKLNRLLDRARLERGDPSFRILTRTAPATEIQPDDLSSGESELISLGIECLVFERECKPDRLNVLLIDEPDVHLHPDLQARFANFLEELVGTGKFLLLIATHSTAFLGAMTPTAARLAFMRPGDTDLQFAPIDDGLRKVLPVFGAHPLSNIFNQAPVLLLEGDDDERIWQQAVRSSQGRIKVYPCGVEDGVAALADFEAEVVRILQAVYDNAVGYSLRDRDEGPAEIGDLGPLQRMRLACRAAENLLVTDDVLSRLGTDWGALRDRIEQWLVTNDAHPHYQHMRAFRDSGFDRRAADLKDVRNDLVGLMNSNKPWEVLVGQTIAGLTAAASPAPASLRSFLGDRVGTLLLGLPPAAAPAEAAAGIQPAAVTL